MEYIDLTHKIKNDSQNAQEISETNNSLKADGQIPHCLELETGLTYNILYGFPFPLYHKQQISLPLKKFYW